MKPNKLKDWQRARIAECEAEPQAIKQAFYDKYVGTDFDTFDGKNGGCASLREYVDDTTAEDRAGDIEQRERAERAQIRSVADNAKRLKLEAKNPAPAMARARAAEQNEMMEGDREEARKYAGEDWADERDEWKEAWLAREWKPEYEAGFVADFKKQWLEDHGTPFPVL